VHHHVLVGLCACQAGSLFDGRRRCVCRWVCTTRPSYPLHLIPPFSHFSPDMPPICSLHRRASPLFYPHVLSSTHPPHLAVDDATVEKATVSLERGGTGHELTNVREGVHFLSLENNLKLGALRGGRGIGWCRTDGGGDSRRASRLQPPGWRRVVQPASFVGRWRKSVSHNVWKMRRARFGESVTPFSRSDRSEVTFNLSCGLAPCQAL
jgi:hypothetical protein